MSEPSHSVNDLDWDKCMLCQTKTAEELRCPANTTRSDVGAGYDTIAKNIGHFQDLGTMPMPISVLELVKVGDLAETIKRHRAKWHKSCQNKFNITELRRAEKRKRSEISNDRSTKRLRKDRSSVVTETSTNVCFFCEVGEEAGYLRKASTFQIDQRVRECAETLQNTTLIGKLSPGDMIAQGALYHAKCLNALYRKARGIKAGEDDHQRDEDDNEKRVEADVLAELVSFLQESRTENQGNPKVFKLADLAQLFTDRLRQLDVDVSSRVNTTHLKNKILEQVPEMQAFNQGRDVLLAFNDDIAQVLEKSQEPDYSNEAMILANAAKIVRRDMFKMKRVEFCGTFESDCQPKAISHPLLTLVRFILDGPAINSQSRVSQAALTVAQLLYYNSTLRRRKGSTATFHAKCREPPIAIYIGLMLHAKTRKRELIDKLHDLGISISYDRVLEISTEVGNAVSQQYEEERVVCPPKLRADLFTTSALDNIDHNPSSTTAQGSLHGTSISIFQHPRPNFSGRERDVPVLKVDNSNRKLSISPLPDAYSCVKPVVLPQKEPAVPSVEAPFVSGLAALPAAISAQNEWLNHTKEVIERDVGDGEQDMKVSWAAFHASTESDSPQLQTDISAMLPLFKEQSKSPAMIRHGMDVIKQAVEYLNPGQTPVITCDQPLYAISKLVQWNFAETYGEQKFVVILGGLHIEMVALKTLGDWVNESGWTAAIVDANIATSGTADSLVKSSHVSRTRHAHQVTACCLHILIHKAYQSYLNGLEDREISLTFEDWKTWRLTESPQFQYWSITLDLELTVLMFVQSIRQGNFPLYRDTLTKLIPWFFALDHTHYARWLPIHLRDMMSLSLKHPDVAKEFQNGKFVIHKTQNPFSGIAIDHAHEQHNKNVKGDGGAVGLTESSSELLRWMVSGPEISRMVGEFEASQELIQKAEDKGTEFRHHEQVKSKQRTFEKQVSDLCSVMQRMGNPFMEESSDLLVLNTRDIADAEIVTTVKTIQRKGQEAFESFVDARIDKRTKSLFDPITKNKLPLFSSPPTKTASNKQQQVASLKKDCALFSQLYVSCQIRGGDLDEFFSHENHLFPPSLSKFGQLRSGTKSDLTRCLEKLPVPVQSDSPDVNALLLDGAVIVQMLKPGPSKTFQQYGQDIFLPYIDSQLQNVNRVDIVWDEYIPDSLKAATRTKRGKGVRRRVEPDNHLPSNWDGFLRVDENKAELFRFLAQLCTTIRYAAERQVISTFGQGAVSNTDRDLRDLCPCTQEEADTRLMLHCRDCAQQGYNKILIRTVDTDVLVISIAMYQESNAQELWIAFGTGKAFRFIAVHEIVKVLGPEKSLAMPAFHAFSGCDQTSSFAGKGKFSAWETWMAFDEVTSAFAAISNSPSEEVVVENVAVFERYVVLLYDRTSTCLTVNQARKDLFTKKGKTMDAIPPTSAALFQHIKRTAYQAGYCWGQALVAKPFLPSPSEWGWTQTPVNKQWEPVWTLLPEASKACQQLTKCSCQPHKGCKGNCKCVKSRLTCTALCKCGGDCEDR